ncbi:TolC family protein [Fulvivirgaceae bacterium BMA12]|uniref:TolC family protein n=1 Tax=Agaribacillus aureus TaxID=3051825 RepID=A0ABT8LDS6_9BACT|nr:TolC family protein [Fulvivirgaceae bacterium BMA12]
MNKFKITLVLFTITLSTSLCFSQGIQKNVEFDYNLVDIIQLAKSQSPAWLQAETRKENRYWQFRTFKSNYNPQLQLQGRLPDFQRRFTPVTQPDGSIEFRSVSNNNSNLSMRLIQNISTTGARVFINSNVARFDDFDQDLSRYNGSPISIGLEQPIFQFNNLAWDKKIEPLRYEESQKGYFEELEQIAIDATQQYFALLLAQINVEMAKKNQANNDTIYKIAQGRYQLGKIGENDLLQLEANLINSTLDVAQAQLDLETSSLNLKSYVGLSDTGNISLSLPAEIPQFPVDTEKALFEANKNRVDPVSFSRRLLQGDREIAQARGDNGVNLDLLATFGLNNSGGEFGDIYRDPNNQQTVSLNLTVPILDWGRQKSRIKTAEANQQLIQYQINQEKVNFEQEVMTHVKRFDMLREQVKVRRKSDDIESRKYEISKQLFLIGKIDITTLNIALRDKDSAKRNYITSLKDFWEAYFTLRKLTLYDFERGDLLLKELNK